MSARAKLQLALGIAVGGSGVLVACVDLFHATDFTTLCDSDAAACATVDANVEVPATPRPANLEDLCTLTPAQAKEEAIRVCAWLGACEGPLGESSFGSCMFHALLAYDCKANPGLRPLGEVEEFWRCLANAQTCAAFDACTFPEGPSKCAPDAGASQKCGTSSARIECGDAEAPVAVEPCAMMGKTCRNVESGAICVASDGACTVSGCDEGNVVARECGFSGGSVDIGVNCAKFGAQKCTTFSNDKSYGCVAIADAETCSDFQGGRCAGTVAQFCIDGRHVDIDCSVFGLGCDAAKGKNGDATKACVPTSEPCTHDLCVGDTLTSCVKGKAIELSCESVKLGPCAQKDNGFVACTRARDPR